jgi:hypothetical protein
MAGHLAGGIPSTRKSSSCERARGLERAGEKGLREIDLPAKSITRTFHTSLRHALCATSGQFPFANLLVFLLAPDGSTSHQYAEIREENPLMWLLPGPPMKSDA